MITGSFLISVQRKAMRKGVLYSALDKMERGILSLAGDVLNKVRSEELGRVIVKILAKLREAMKSGFQSHMESYGIKKARKMINIARKFGKKVNWFTMNYVRYLSFIDYNNPIGWSTI